MVYKNKHCQEKNQFMKCRDDSDARTTRENLRCLHWMLKALGKKPVHMDRRRISVDIRKHYRKNWKYVNSNEKCLWQAYNIFFLNLFIFTWKAGIHTEKVRENPLPSAGSFPKRLGAELIPSYESGASFRYSMWAQGAKDLSQLLLLPRY